MKIEHGRIVVDGRRYHIDVERVRREHEGAEVVVSLYGGGDQVLVFLDHGNFLSRATFDGTIVDG